MAINSDIRDQAYQFFTEEAPELLQILEAGLLTLNQERSTAKVHNLMRAAHSLKGGASSVGLDAIATLAHRLENILKALYSDSLEIDTALEDDLLRAYDCLRLPLMEQITTGSFNPEALAIADPIFTQIETRCGDALLQAETYIPSSAELGIDMVKSLFEVDVVQGLDRLAAILANPQTYEVAGELRAQIEVFIGFAELLNIPGFKAIAETAQQALKVRPDRALEITQLTLTDLERSRQAVLAGDHTQIEISSALTTLANTTLANTTLADTITAPAMSAPVEAKVEATEPLQVALPQLKNLLSLFGDSDNSAEMELGQNEELANTALLNLDMIRPSNPSTLEGIGTQSLLALEDLGDNAEASSTAFIPPFSNTENTDLPTLESLVNDQEQGLEDVVLSSSDSLDGIVTTEIDASFSEVIEAEWVGHTASEMAATEQVLRSPGKLVPAGLSQLSALQISESTGHDSSQYQRKESTPFRQVGPLPTPNITVRVDSDRLEKISNLVGELSINRNGLALQNEQLQEVLRELLNRFERFEDIVSNLRESLDQMLIAPEHNPVETASSQTARGMEQLGMQNRFTRPTAVTDRAVAVPALTEFDSLEMDSYGVLHTQLQEILENFVQLDETVDDVTLYARQSEHLLDQQRHTLTNLSSELTQARMLPLGEVLNRFPRMLRDLSASYHKPVSLKLTGARLLVDRAILEKLYDPLLHLLRNAFDHGIEAPQLREQLGKPAEGQIEIRAYHRGSQTIIEVKDDGQGLNLDRIRSRAFELGWLSTEQLLVTPPDQLFEFIFEPGFSTARQVSELSGRGIGLDVVRSQLQAIKGTVGVTSSPREGTTFTLRLPLTLTNTKLIICSVNSTNFALPVEGLEEILTPKEDQIRQSGTQRFLYWREQIIPTYRLDELLNYAGPVFTTASNKSVASISSTASAPPVLILNHEQQKFALEVDHLMTEQELVIKPFGPAVKPPGYLYGCTTLGDGSLIPVIDSTALLAFKREQTAIVPTKNTSQLITSRSKSSNHQVPTEAQPLQLTTILVVDDAITLRRTLALSLERSGYRVLQARDGQEAIDQLRHSSAQLVICDIEMPNMNGFEFLSYRRQDPVISKIPIMMLTSRSNEKHRWLAIQLGATAYFTKPYLEHEFLAAIETLVQA